MNTRMSAARRALVLGALVAGALSAGAGRADAAVSARVEAGTLRITSNSAADTIWIGAQPGSPGMLQVDIGGDGTGDLFFDRSTFTAIQVAAGGGDDEVRVVSTGGTIADEAVRIDGGAAPTRSPAASATRR